MNACAHAPPPPLPTPPPTPSIEAKKFALRLPDYEERVELLLSLGAFTEAADAAVKQKDVPRLQSILENSPTAAAKDISEKALIGLGVMEASAGGRGRGGRGGEDRGGPRCASFVVSQLTPP